MTTTLAVLTVTLASYLKCTGTGVAQAFTECWNQCAAYPRWEQTGSHIELQSSVSGCDCATDYNMDLLEVVSAGNTTAWGPQTMATNIYAHVLAYISPQRTISISYSMARPGTTTSDADDAMYTCVLDYTAVLTKGPGLLGETPPTPPPFYHDVNGDGVYPYWWAIFVGVVVLILLCGCAVMWGGMVSARGYYYNSYYPRYFYGQQQQQPATVVTTVVLQPAAAAQPQQPPPTQCDSDIPFAKEADDDDETAAAVKSTAKPQQNEVAEV